MAFQENTRSKEFYVGASRLFSIDFVKDLDGDTLTPMAATWTVSNGSLAKSNETNSTTVCTVRLTSTTPGTYTAAVSCPTAGGNTMVDYLIITVKAIGS